MRTLAIEAARPPLSAPSVVTMEDPLRHAQETSSSLVLPLKVLLLDLLSNLRLFVCFKPANSIVFSTSIANVDGPMILSSTDLARINQTNLVQPRGFGGLDE